MANVVSVTPSCLSNVRPPVTSHAPSIWADYFANSSIDEQAQQRYVEAIESLKQEARSKLMAAATPLQQMIFIDTLERLGLAYHFETEIEQILQQINDADDRDNNNYDLFTTSLRFRLLRQHQHHISCNVFDKFVGKDGKFEEALSRDPEGLLSLYDAAHVWFRDEKILQEAAMFTRHHLRGMAQLESPLKEKVKRALEHPLHREVPIFYASFFISLYETDDSRDELLLKLAKFNLNFLQNLYKNELRQLCRWWNKFDLQSKLPYARNRIVEAYHWGTAYHYEPQYAYVRMGIAKVLQLLTILDDTYDNYATVDEAEMFTQILDKWNMEETGELPDYMKIVYEYIMGAFEDFEGDAAKQGKELAAPYYKEKVLQLSRAYNKELKWVMGREMPSFQDYLKNSEITSCVFLMFASIIPGLKSATKETIEWMESPPKFAISAAMLGRYWNDVGSFERENKGGEVLTVVDCYMKQYGVSKDDTITKFAEEIEEKWLDVNEEWVKTTVVPKETAVHLLNYSRMCDTTYSKNNGDGYTDPKVYKAQIEALYINPIPI